ncbi:twin-arginine translocase subunit TatC [Paenibacillus azoreducens]|uniref:Sec-independent protein translocase protein TatC n=1 Tax=Paenibacillus azoreducens TaxID=116718 RepID=A0A919YJB6_9BACL|nr:twin-arginine translocase subunit TatC [Paenibacillus azoreducens]GIO49710.1 Sec-independent protein translocase protein TatCy [Paenibacillus azoreducens]
MNWSLFAEHLSELRKRLFWILAVFLASMITAMFFTDDVLHFLKSRPPASLVAWNAFSPFDGIKIYMYLSAALSMIVAVPFTLFQIWGFVKRGLRKDERKAALKYIPAAFVLIIVGFAFAYFVVFPMAFRFTTDMTKNLGLVETYGIAQYFSFLTNIVVPVSLAFELPVIVMFLTRLRILNPAKLVKIRKVSYMVLVFIACMISPPEFFSHISVSLPFIALYEISVLMSRVVYRKQRRLDTEYGDRMNYGAV